MLTSPATRIAALAVTAALLSGATSASPRKTDPSLTRSGLRWVSRTLVRMSLEQKVGQMIGIRANGDFISADSETLKGLESLVGELKVGGVVFFAGQVFETAWLANHLQKRAEIPLLISSDYERGAAFRVEGATAFPPLMALGAADSEELAYQMGRITAVEGRAMGVHQALAPVADVNINPLNPIISTRSVGEDPEQVGRLTRAFVLGCQRHGMICTAKHYPGHGDTDVDTHLNLAVVTADRDRLEQVELLPFRRLVDAGVMSVMTGHLSVPALDAMPGRPATLSPVLLTDLLRRQMNFRGLIVTDAMDMGGITTLFPPGEAAVRAVEAGADMVLLPADPREAARALLEAVRSGRIPEYRVNSSVRRILGLKARLGLHRDKTVELERLPEIIGSENHRFWSARAFRESLTLVKNEGSVLPLEASLPKLAVLSLSSDEDDYFAGKTFVQEVLKRRKDAVSGYADGHTDSRQVQDLVAKAREADTILVALFSRLQDRKGTVGLNPAHAQAVRDLVSDGKSVAVVSFDSPYFLTEFPEAAGYICAYRSSPEAQQAAAAAIFGERGFSGRLPVSLPGLFPRGHGLALAERKEGEE